MQKYADPEHEAIAAYQRFIAAKEKVQRREGTGAAFEKAYAQMLLLQREYRRLAQYARKHQKQEPVEETDSTSAALVATRELLTKERETSAKLRRCLKAAQEQLSLPVDKRDLDVIRSIHKA